MPSRIPEGKANDRNTPILETERLLLREFTDNDIEALFAIYKDEEVNTFLPWFPLKSLDEAKILFYEKYAGANKPPMEYRYAICLKTDLVPIGYVHVSAGDGHDLGYGLCREFWHKGIATEAGKAVLERAKRDGLPYVTATHDIRNPRSGGVMKQLGMRYMYSYEELWQPKNRMVTFRMYQLNLDGQDGRIYQAYWEKYAVHFVENGV